MSDVVTLGPRGLRRVLVEAWTEPEFDPDEAERVLDLIADGCDPAAMPPGLLNWRAIRSWVRRFPDFARAYNEACEAAADRISWDTLAIADNITEHPASRAVRIKARQDLAKVLNRRKYDPGTVIAAAGVAGRVQDMSTAALLDALAAEGRPVIEHEAPGAPPIFEGVGADPYGRGPHPENPPLPEGFEPV